jgi:TolB-like protein
MPDPVKPAVFLSYAREDHESARRIAEALRGFGIEAWFDQSELRGGDAWDQKIRRQIKECTLFIPVISAHTQQRGEGYFRLEWKLAAERTHLMAEGVPFLAPVVVDGTPDGGAAVPPEFLKVQWTRLPGGMPTPQFVDQVSRLLAAPKTAAPWSSGELRPRSAATGAAPVQAGARAGLPAWIWVVAAVIVLGIAGALLAPRFGASGADAAATVSAKSIAVLPFDNLSTDKDLEFFADGMHDEVISALTKIRDLKVISRSSVMAYRDRTKRHIPTIGTELGVATILEGSVQRSGNQVKVIVQLIDARKEGHLWNGQYVKELTKTFEIQSELAEAITGSLGAALSPGEKSLIARRPTENQEAYDLYLRAQTLAELYYRTGIPTREQYDEVIGLYERALLKDPAFSMAYGRLVALHGIQYWYGFLDPSLARKARAREALDAAMRLAPNAPETHFAQGEYFYRCENDWARALEEFRRAEAGMPNEPNLVASIGFALRRLGRIAESLEPMERASALNPGDALLAGNIPETYAALRRYSEARDRAARNLALFPKGPSDYLAWLQYELDHNREALIRKLEESPVEESRDPTGMQKASYVAVVRGDLAAAERALQDPRLTSLVSLNGAANEPVALARAGLAFLRGRPEDARRQAEDAISAYRAGAWTARQESTVMAGTAFAHALAGRTDAALKLGREAFVLAKQRDQYLAADQWIYLAKTYLVLDRRDDAFALLREMMIVPNGYGPEALRLDPFWARVKDDPRFDEALKLAKRL